MFGVLHRSRRRHPVYLGCLIALLGVVSGCGPRRPATLENRFVRGAQGRVTVDAPPDVPSGQILAAGPQLPADTPIPKSSSGETIESQDGGLRTALAELGRGETATALRRVAGEYHRLQIFDRAEKYLSRAIAVNPRDWESFEARARVWRDWGVPARGLTDAHQAIYLAPQSAEARNTLGTVLFALDLRGEAAQAFTAAFDLDPRASWARSNLCYVSLVAGDEAAALSHCAAALALDPQSAAAHNNLALVHASAGRLDEAAREFLVAGSAADGHYNFGIVLLARREYARAQRAFEEAGRAEPGFEAAFTRAREARRLAARASSGGN